MEFIFAMKAKSIELHRKMNRLDQRNGAVLVSTSRLTYTIAKGRSEKPIKIHFAIINNNFNEFHHQWHRPRRIVSMPIRHVLNIIKYSQMESAFDWFSLGKWTRSVPPTLPLSLSLSAWNGPFVSSLVLNCGVGTWITIRHKSNSMRSTLFDAPLSWENLFRFNGFARKKGKKILNKFCQFCLSQKCNR